MRIALVTFEYPPDTAVGGIATYMKQWARLLKDRGHDVEVFCASPFRDGSINEDGITVHHCKTEERSSFKYNVVPVFSSRHSYRIFDVIESPEYGLDAREINQKYPAVTLVVKLHTPSFLMDRLNDSRRKVGLLERCRVTLGAWRRLKSPSRYWQVTGAIDKEEADFIRSADLITSPSKSLGQIVASQFRIDHKRIHHLPNPYVPGAALLGIDVNASSQVITYFGRLEKRKGILIMKDVIPKVLAKHPSYKFRLVGGDTIIYPEAQSAKQLLLQHLSAYSNGVEFKEHVPLEQIPQILSDTQICVFPSIWENFPTVCLEAMSAGRAIVGSREGGMSDMLETPKAGLLIDPLQVDEIVAAINSFIASPQLRRELGLQARQSVLDKYNSEVIGSRFESLLASVKSRSN